MTTNRTIGLIGAFILLIGGQNIGGGTGGYLLAQDRPGDEQKLKADGKALPKEDAKDKEYRP